MFTSVYSGLTYAIFLSMFEFFPMVYGDIYGMAPGEIGLVLICNIIATIVAGVPYLAFVYYKVNPSVKQGRPMSPERQLLPAVLGSLLVPAGIFMFGWTSRPSIHWIVPTIGALLSTSGFVVILQSIFVYITLAYPTYAASLFAGNGFIKGWGQGKNNWGVIVTGNIDIDYEAIAELSDMIITLNDPFEGKRFEQFRALATAAKADGSLILGQPARPRRPTESKLKDSDVDDGLAGLDAPVPIQETFLTYGPLTVRGAVEKCFAAG
ncbi:hypothetical protein CEP54_008834 [Fusarium duplospermum]|uniref:Uncharacterized protein n=1 Tax=Fusarium duplospermum TaxID=1325734 RepID=A0A428PTJ6_9HYPO|nr:hypothetical protein CEP54_008834 [Fusarium duplospermum]